MLVHRRCCIGEAASPHKLFRMRDTWYLFGFIPVYSRQVDI